MHHRKLLIGVVGSIFLLGCACGQLLTGDPLFDARGFVEDADELIAERCSDEAIAAQLRQLIDQVWGVTAEGLLTTEDIFALEDLLEERLADGCQAEDVAQILAQYPVLAP